MTTDHFNQLNEAEAERLALLAEECAEVIQVVGKILRHGYESEHPDEKDGRDNRALLEVEAGHVQAALQLMFEATDLDKKQVVIASKNKLTRVTGYLHHQQ